MAVKPVIDKMTGQIVYIDEATGQPIENEATQTANANILGQFPELGQKMPDKAVNAEAISSIRQGSNKVKKAPAPKAKPIEAVHNLTPNYAAGNPLMPTEAIDPTMRNNYADQQRTLEKEYKSQGAGGSASGLTPVASGAPQPTRFEYAKGTSGKVYKVPVAFAPATDPGSWIQSSMKTDGINMPIWRKKGDAEGLGQGMAPAPSMLPIDGNPQVDHSKVPVAPPKKIFPTAWEDPAAQPVTNAKPFNWMDLIASGFGTAADVHAMTPGQINPKMLAAQEYRETEEEEGNPQSPTSKVYQQLYLTYTADLPDTAKMPEAQVQGMTAKQLKQSLPALQALYAQNAEIYNDFIKAQAAKSAIQNSQYEKQEKRDEKSQKDLEKRRQNYGKSLDAFAETDVRLDEIDQIAKSMNPNFSWESFSTGEFQPAQRENMVAGEFGVLQKMLGPINTVRNLMGNKNITKFETAMSGISNALLKARSGGAVTPNEYDRLMKELNDSKNKTEYDKFIALAHVYNTIKNAKQRAVGTFGQDAAQSFYEESGLPVPEYLGGQASAPEQAPVAGQSAAKAPVKGSKGFAKVLKKGTETVTATSAQEYNDLIDQGYIPQ